MEDETLSFHSCQRNRSLCLDFLNVLGVGVSLSCRLAVKVRFLGCQVLYRVNVGLCVVGSDQAYHLCVICKSDDRSGAIVGFAFVDIDVIQKVALGENQF